MASFAYAQSGMAPCLRLPVRIRTQTGATHRQAPHAFNARPARPDPRRHFHISDFMRAVVAVLLPPGPVRQAQG